MLVLPGETHHVRLADAVASRFQNLQNAFGWQPMI